MGLRRDHDTNHAEAVRARHDAALIKYEIQERIQLLQNGNRPYCDFADELEPGNAIAQSRFPARSDIRDPRLLSLTTKASTGAEANGRREKCHETHVDDHCRKRCAD